MKKVLITTSIPYVNGAPHIGHALELVQSDTMARAYREDGYDTYFLTGTDENAQKNVESAEKAGIPVQTLVDQNSERFQNLKKPLNLSFDQFIRTTSDKHMKGAQKLWKLCEKDIYKKKYSGLYCVGCETFYKDGEFENNICPNHNRKLELVTEENYFFALSRYSEKIRDVIQSDMLKIDPAFRKQEMLNFIDKGLEDFSISRPVERMKGWGVPVPGDENQRMYVWYDALANYITALDFAENGQLFRSYWTENPNRIHVIGKDIIKFHAIYWVGMLLSAEIMLPTREYVHGFISVSGQKMSKSLGNVIDPYEVVEKFGTDAVRYYLLKEIPSLTDGDFSIDRMKQLYDADLANELGNLVSRVTTLASKDELTFQADTEADKYILDKAKHFQFNQALEDIWKIIKDLNKEINEKEPWKLSADDRKGHLENWLGKLYGISLSLKPFMPDTADKIGQATSGKIGKTVPLFPRI
ncbi:methionine--tRNA ligase [Candidatus Roizmanbacteria bacterium]|nr:MAG: methionine--tRNA ligase [Candidatus Roizmanbacteria bacterium]